MKYLSPVINHVHNNLNTHISIRLSGGRYSFPAKETTNLDFDIMSCASNYERDDLFSAIRSNYIAVDVLMLKDGQYVKVGEYSTEEVGRVRNTSKAKATNPTKAEDIAKRIGITVKDSDDSVIKEPTKTESISKVEQVAEPVLDPIKAINDVKPRKYADSTKKSVQASKESVLESIKEKNTEKGK